MHREVTQTQGLTTKNAIELVSSCWKETNLSQNYKAQRLRGYKHQVLAESDDFFYKVYEGNPSILEPFFSLVRNSLAVVYEQCDIHWKVVSFDYDGKHYDFEQRQKLEVCKSDTASFERILLSFSKLLDKVHVLLEFDSIVQQLKSHKAFAKVARLQLARPCINKHNDYALHNGQAVLLDDAEWYIALLDANGTPLIVPPKYEIPVFTSYGKFYFSAYSIIKNIDGTIEKGTTFNDAFMHGWFLLPQGKSSVSNGAEQPQQSFIQTAKATPDKFNIASNTQAQTLHALATLERKVEGAYPFFPVLSSKVVMSRGGTFSNDDLLYNIGGIKAPFQWGFLDSNNKLQCLLDLLGALNNFDASKFNNVSLLGVGAIGNQCENETVERAFSDVVNKIGEMYASKAIGSVWVYASLKQGRQRCLYKMLEAFRQVGVVPNSTYGNSGLWLFTEWGASGIFNSPAELANWEFHMQNISGYYPWVKRNTTIALTQGFCESYLSESFMPHHFMGKYQTSLCYKPPAFCAENKSDSPNLPDRTTFRRFLMKYAKRDADTFDGMLDTKYVVPCVHQLQNHAVISAKNEIEFGYNSVGGVAVVGSSANPNCNVADSEKKHGLSYAAYSNSAACMLCDKQQIWQGVWQH